MADDDDAKGAQKLAMQGRDDYWHCLAREYSRDSNQGMSEQDFGRSVAGACPSERQYYRVALLDYLTSQYPTIEFRRPSRDREQGGGGGAEGYRDRLRQAPAAAEVGRRRIASTVAVRQPFRPCAHPWYHWPHLEQGRGGMSSELVGGIFGAIVAAVVLAVAVVFGPIGQYGKPPSRPRSSRPAAMAPAAPAAPAPRGPVIREVPNQ